MEILVLGWNQTRMRLKNHPILTNTEIAEKYPSASDDYPFHQKKKKNKRSGSGTCFSHFF
jgi:hypothetical protein